MFSCSLIELQFTFCAFCKNNFAIFNDGKRKKRKRRSWGLQVAKVRPSMTCKNTFFSENRIANGGYCNQKAKCLKLWNFDVDSSALFSAHFYDFLVKWGHFFLKFSPFAPVFGI